MVVLITQGLDFALKKDKPIEIKKIEWKSMQKKATSHIQLGLAPEVKYIVLSETTSSNI